MTKCALPRKESADALIWDFPASRREGYESADARKESADALIWDFPASSEK